MISSDFVPSGLVSQVGWMEQQGRPITTISTALVSVLGLQEGSSLDGALDAASLESLGHAMKGHAAAASGVITSTWI